MTDKQFLDRLDSINLSNIQKMQLKNIIEDIVKENNTGESSNNQNIIYIESETVIVEDYPVKIKFHVNDIICEGFFDINSSDNVISIKISDEKLYERLYKFDYSEIVIVINIKNIEFDYLKYSFNINCFFAIPERVDEELLIGQSFYGNDIISFVVSKTPIDISTFNNYHNRIKTLK